MEQRQAVVTRIPLPVPLLWRCRCYGVAPHRVAAAAVAAVPLPSARHTGAARSNSNTHSSCSVHSCRAYGGRVQLTD